MGHRHLSHPSANGSRPVNEKSAQRQTEQQLIEIRSALAKKHNATIGCPLTTGIFAWISANAAEEQKQQGAADITPYWRTLKTGGFLNEKYPGGLEAQKLLLEQEGHVVIRKRQEIFVKDYLKAVIPLDQ